MDSFDSYGNAEFGDERLSKRLPRLLAQLSRKPESNISASCQDPYQAKAVYRFVGNDDVSLEAIAQITHEVTVDRITQAKPSVVLALQDTTELNYSSLKATSGLGTIASKDSSRGIHLHSAIAVSEEGEMFGILAQKQWVRPVEEFGKTDDTRAKTPIEGKESFKWLEALEDSGDSIPEATSVVHVCDREGDVFEFFSKAEEENTQYLCRVRHDRKVDDENETNVISTFVSSLPVAETITVHVPRDSHTQREARDAELEVKFGKCKVLKPKSLAKHKQLPESMEVYIVSAAEVDSDNKEKIFWQLITNVPTDTLEDALTRIAWYTQRWKIETFHRTLKSGCKVEKLQSDSADKLMKLIAIYSIIALQVMTFCYVARARPDQSCEIHIAEEDWKILYKVAKKTKKLPETAPTIHEAVVMIAKLGGFLARKSDGAPGVTVIWRGLTSFYTILDAVQFLA